MLISTTIYEMSNLTIADQIDIVDPEDVSLVDAPLGYNILVKDVYAGAIEGIPGQLEYVEVDPHWQGKGVARAAVNDFIELSRKNGLSEVTTNNALDPAMEHILKTEDFEQQSEGIGWVKEIR
jgi:GNAT superfamily N-acetyltransferase